jgi:CRP-like cAMP-binding protein
LEDIKDKDQLVICDWTYNVEQILTILEKDKKGEYNTRESEIGEEMFILIDGEVEISKNLFLPQLSNQPSLQEKSLTRLTEKHRAFFGEMALFLDHPERSATIKTAKMSKLFVLHKEALEKVLEQDKALGMRFYRNIATELVKRLIESNQNVLKLTTAFSLAMEGD